jgi:hypothetical protein
MTDKVKSFGELLEAAPSAEESSVSLTGTLVRNADSKKFSLILADGRNVTLDVASVKHHSVVAGSAGRSIVQIEVSPGDVPADVTQSIALPNTRFGFGTNPAWGEFPTIAHFDINPGGRYGNSYYAPGSTSLGGPQTGYPDQAAFSYAHPGSNPQWDNPYTPVGLDLHFLPWIDPFTPGIPFGLATAHQSAEAAAMAARGFGAQPAYPGLPPNYKFILDGGKHPEQDLTTPPHKDI